MKKQSEKSFDNIWISPKGEKLAMKGWYVDEVLEDPANYGFSEDQIDEIFVRHEEDKNQVKGQGQAGEEIMGKQLKKGWIRIRYKKNIPQYYIELINLSSEMKNYLRNWATELISKNPKRKDFAVKIIDLHFEIDDRDYTGEETPDENLYSKQEWSLVHNNPLIYLNLAEDFSDLAPRKRYIAYKQRVVGREIELRRKLSDLEVEDLMHTLKFSPVYLCSLEDVAKGELLVSTEAIYAQRIQRFPFVIK